MLVHVTHSAVRDYIQQVAPGATREAALEAILADLPRAHVIEEQKPRRDGRELWRGPKPKRVRYVVERHPDRCDVVAVLPAHGGLQRRRERMPGDEHIQATIEMADPRGAFQETSAPSPAATRPAPPDPGKKA